MHEEKPLSVYIIAGEASGDLIGAHLMRSLKKQSRRPIVFNGIGGEKMIAEGMKSLFPFHELSMLGFLEILPYLFNIFARIARTVEDIRIKQPDVVITIDVPGFGFRVVERLRKTNIPSKFIHYVAPTVWAYKPHRAAICAKLFDHMLVLLPFEPPYFKKVGLPCTWVGHPVIAETVIGDGTRFRQKYEIPDSIPLFCLMPGSRKGEVERHMPIFAKTIALLATQFPNLAMVVAVPANVMPFVAPFFNNCPFRAVVTADDQDKKDAIAASTIAIVKSGTVTFEIAKAGVPMIVTYRVNPISAWMFRRIALTKYANLINILKQSEVIPELLQEQCNPLMIATSVAHLLSHPDRQKTQIYQQKSALAQLLLPNDESPSDKAAHTILNLI
jgi:lipid-A-disaccharide synthase